MTAALLSVGVSGVGPPSAAAQLGQCRVGADGSGLERTALRVDELPDLRQELAELGHDPSRSFSSTMASIGPGSTSLASAT